MILITMSLLLLAVGSINAQQAWEIWPDKDLPPRNDEILSLPLPLDSIGGDGGHHLSTEPTMLESDGLPYKTMQLFRDSEFTVEVPTDRYLLGFLGRLWPQDTVDGLAWISSMQLSVDIDDQTYDLTSDDIQFFEGWPFPGVDLTAYNFYPRFLQPGQHKLTFRWRQKEPFFFQFPFGLAIGAPPADPLPEFEGRRVLVAEQEGSPVDGEMVLTYHLTVVEATTAVEPGPWGKIKGERR